MSALRVVLLGVLGHGKTFLFNKITEANEPVIFGGKSVTKQIVIGQAAHGEFEIVDTPGFDAIEDKLLHAAGVIAALAQGDVNRILVVVKCERTDLMIKNIKKIIGSIQRYKDLITIIVSYWDEKQRNIIKNNKSVEDQQKQELEAKQDIEQDIKNNFNIKSVIFTSFDDDPINITNMILHIILQSRFTKINLQESEIYSQFDLLSLDEESEMEFNKSINKIKNGFRRISKSFLKYIENQKLDEPYLIDKLHYLSLVIKDIANQKIEDFEKNHGDYMNETYDTDGVNIRYLYHIYLKKEIRLDLEQVIKKAQSKMKESQNHCFNWIKQCPYCGLVWIKVVGCEYETTCGNRVYSSFDDLLRKPEKLNRYKIIIKNDSIDVEIEQEKKTENQQAIKQDEDIYLKLYNSVKDDPIFSMNFQIYLINYEINQLIYNFATQLIGYESLSYYYENKDEESEQMLINEFKNGLRVNGWLSNDYNNEIITEQQSLGCGRQIVWKDLPPLSGPLLQELLTPELLDYFNDQDQLLKDEADDIAKELQKTYKDLVNQAIKEQMKHIKVIPKQQNQIQTQKQENDDQKGDIKQNYQNLIQETKIQQQQIKRIYSVKMMTDSSLYEDTETINTSRTQQSETQSSKNI
ncbi:unnamed protein product [Paramecium primaurelia]|uniref:G domain-containing protein n=1 Tax=Paramecium primaurelia TaxID=5886 RepID=A0A8S1MK11_PARPR|nr:unnamed protein product [Paramecium primaurelia]